uniref:Uncharacterized protein n=1 Tax=Strigamia maritima TaxID=126957 RepID=T1IX85_STRMM
MVNTNLEWLQSAHGIVKTLEFVVSVISLALTYGYGIVTTSQTEINFCLIIMPTNVFILFYLIISYVFDENKPGKLFVMQKLFLPNQITFCLMTSTKPLLHLKTCQTLVKMTLPR